MSLSTSGAQRGFVRRYLSFAGRATRTTFLPLLFAVLVTLVPLAIAVPPLAALITLVIICPLAAAATRRFHDVGLSGRWLLPLIFVPVLMLTILVLGNSMLTLILVAAIDGSVSDGDISRACIAAETALAWVLGVNAGLSCIAFLWTGVRGPNKYGDNPRRAPDPRRGGQ